MRTLMQSTVIALATATTVFAANPATVPAGGNAQEIADRHVMARSLDLSADDAKALEEKLTKNPQDIDSRIALLAFYLTERHNASAAAKRQREHVLWMIENAPDRSITGTPICEFGPDDDPEAFDKAVQLWHQQIDRMPANPVVLNNAANFVMHVDRKSAVAFLERAKQASPNDPRWPSQLGSLYMFGPDDNQKQNAATAFKEFELAEQLTPDPQEKWHLMNDLAKAAFLAGEYDHAIAWAQQSITAAAQYPKDWNYGNAIHHGNITVGRVALQRNDIATAKQSLLAAGKTRGSPQLNSFGPSMTLASELLARGERETVLEYLQLCKNFWRMNDGRLDAWTNAIKTGKAPDFNPNLAY